MNSILLLARRLALAWMRVHTIGMADELRLRRLREYESFLWEMVSDGRQAGRSETSLSLSILGDLLRGMPSDIGGSVARINLQRAAIAAIGIAMLIIGVGAFLWGGVIKPVVGGGGVAQSAFMAIMFLSLGLLTVIKPELAVEIRVWTARTVLGARVVPSQRTYLLYRIVGAVFTVLGVYNLYMIQVA